VKKTPRVELVCVGSELLSGKQSTHGPFVAQLLARAGLALARETALPDEPREMESFFCDLWRRADVILSTGGLGPTFDDITREAWSRVTRRPLKENPRLVQNIQHKFKMRGLAMPAQNRRQAQVLRGAKVLDNPFGTAPGQWLSVGQKALALLPGPARECRPMFENQVLPALKRLYPGRRRLLLNWRIFGKPESVIDEAMQAFREKDETMPGPVKSVWGIIAGSFIIDIKVALEGAQAPALAERARAIDRELRRLFPGDIFGTGADTLESAVGRLLQKKGQTLATAESCTGGLIAQKLTSVPGSSDYFLGGFVSYADAPKKKMLGVRAATLQRFGAVSEAVCKEMAQGCRKKTGADWAISVTGVAGPGGGTAQKPVGLVYIGLAGPRTLTARRFHFGGDRGQIRERAALSALEMLRRRVFA
jgi:nicotinamide-nucleotide amidase